MSKGDQKSYETAIKANADLILDGWLVCVDQATGLGDSDPGYASFYKGELQESGTLQVSAKGLPEALRQIQEQLTERGLNECDFLVVEAHRGRLVHPHLHYSSGAILAGVECWAWTKIPVQHWKKTARANPDYKKGDENDAIEFGRTVVGDARGVRDGTWPPVRRSTNRTRSRRKRSRTRRTKR